MIYVFIINYYLRPTTFYEPLTQFLQRSRLLYGINLRTRYHTVSDLRISKVERILEYPNLKVVTLTFNLSVWHLLFSRFIRFFSIQALLHQIV